MFSSVKGKNEDETRLLPEDVAPTYGSLGARSPTLGPRLGSTFIEPVMILFLVAQTLSDTVVTNLLEHQTCKAELMLPEDNCSDPISPEVEGLVQPTTARVIMGRSLIEAFIPTCMALLIGPWSDANGRKPFLVISLAGMTVTYMCWGCLALLPNIYPYFFPLASIPLSLTGGPSAIYLLVYCYVTDITEESTRHIRMAVLSLAITVSGVVGMTCAPLLLQMQNSLNPYPAVFFMSSLLLLVATLYTLWGIRETVDVTPDRETRLFLFEHVQELGLACFKPREGRARIMILLISSTLTLTTFIYAGEYAVMYLSTREMFNWQLTDYTRFSSIASIICGFGSLVGVWLLVNVLHMTNMYASLLVLATRLGRSVIMAVSKTGRDFYVSIYVSCIFPAHSPLCRTELSRLVSSKDLGKVFALISFFESLSPMIASPAYTYVYETTFLEHPTDIYWLSAAVSLSTILLITIVIVLQKLANGTCYVHSEISVEHDIN